MFTHCRYFNHLAKLIDSVHILCSDFITIDDMSNADNMLSSFVADFEVLYGEINMVSNVHQLLHLSKCVRINGPLFCYSTYPFEDFIGHQVSFVSGKIDVLEQISERYILEKKFLNYVQTSQLAYDFYNKIRSDKPFAVAQKIQNATIIGKNVTISKLNEEEENFIMNYFMLDDFELINEYKSILLNSHDFYTCFDKNRTCDGLVYNTESNSFDELKSIFTFQNRVFFLLNQKYKVSNRWKNICNSIKPLETIQNSEQKIIDVTSVGPKYVFIQYENFNGCAKFPNVNERN